MKHIGHPVAGDPVYGVKNEKLGFNKQLLHAAVLSFKHPGTGEEMTFKAPLPADFEAVLKKLKEKE
jgi:23S rRNA pseudouridine1911/1915/1917 synthase